MRKTAFVDTGAWIALVNARDIKHAAAAACLEALNLEGARLLTSNYVVDESATRLRYDVGLPAALALRSRLDQAVERGFARVAWVDPRSEAEAWGLMESHPDLKLSLTDATSAVVCRRAKVETVFGFDGDFRALGFQLVP